MQTAVALAVGAGGDATGSGTVRRAFAHFPTVSVATVGDLAADAESLGFDRLWFGDSQTLFRDLAVCMAVAATRTERIGLGPAASNFTTRHPTVSAGMVASLYELAPDRLAWGVCTGDTSVRFIGVPPQARASFASSIQELRTLLRGERVTNTTTGATYHLRYLDAGVPVPIYVTASGPQALALSGRLGDGSIMFVGSAPELVGAALARVRSGAAESGRSPELVDTVLWLPTAISEDERAARDAVRPHVARLLRRDVIDLLSNEHQQIAHRIREVYDMQRHLDPASPQARLVTDELVEMFALAGDVAHCRSRLEQIAATGVDEVALLPFPAPGQDVGALMRSIAAL